MFCLSMIAINLISGKKVKASCSNATARSGSEIVMTSKNGVSLMIGFNGTIGGHLNYMPVMYHRRASTARSSTALKRA